MEILIPFTDDKSKSVSWKEVLGKTIACKPLRPFADTAVEFVQEVSQRILGNKAFRSHPELMAMAYWMRAAHVKEIYQDYEAKRQERIWLPRGVVLHFAPSNVDTIFIYSWFLSLLVGNINVIRLSLNRGTQISLLLNVINDILDQDKFLSIRDRILVVSYGHEEALTAALSECCQIRVIWGGDETVRQIRTIPIPPDATEVVFPDKFSFAVIKSDAILSASNEKLKDVIHNFYNDAFWFDQMACSSARLVVWIGDKDETEKAKSIFWSGLEEYVAQKNIGWGAEVGITRMVTGYSYAALGLADNISTCGTALPYRVHLVKMDQSIRQHHCGGGLFLETEFSVLKELAQFLKLNDQTMAVFGFSLEELRCFAWELGGSGVNRIVPIGQALNFKPIWDGYDLLIYFTREISVC